MPAPLDLPHAASILSLTSPRFRMRYPDIRHRERIPAGPLAAMEASWRRGVFDEREVGFWRLDDVYIAEEGLVFDRAGRLYRASITQHAEAEIARGRAAVMAAIAGRPVQRVAGTAMLCKKRGTGNFGHWIAEMLPRACLAHAFLTPSPDRYLVPDAQGALGRIVAESLAMLGLGEGAIHRVGAGVTHCERLIVLDGLTEHGAFMSPLVTTCLDMLSARIKGGAERRLLIARRHAPSRRFRDEARIEHEARARGFAVVDPGGMTLAAQIALFKGAGEIVGVMGAEMANLAFAPSTARICTIAPAVMPDTFFWFLAGLRGAEYRELRAEQSGPNRGIAPWDRDIELDDTDIAYAFGERRS